MQAYHNILFATDLTSVSHVAAGKTRIFAQKCDAELSIVHVVEPVSPVPYRFVSSLNIEQQHEAKARELVAKLGDELSVPRTKQHVQLGLRKKTILEVANNINSDLIIVNDHGRSGMVKLLGSTANAVLNSAPCDVLVLKCRTEGEASMQVYQHILYATDLSPASFQAAKRAKEMADLLGAKLSIVHVAEKLNTIAYSYIGGIDIDKEMMEESHQQIAKLAMELGIAADGRYIKVGNAKTELLELSQSISADLIVMSSHGHSGLGKLIGSTTNAVLNHADCDVLVVRLKV